MASVIVPKLKEHVRHVIQVTPLLLLLAAALGLFAGAALVGARFAQESGKEYRAICAEAHSRAMSADDAKFAGYFELYLRHCRGGSMDMRKYDVSEISLVPKPTADMARFVEAGLGAAGKR